MRSLRTGFLGENGIKEREALGEREREEQLGSRETDPEPLRTKGAGVRKPW